MSESNQKPCSQFWQPQRGWLGWTPQPSNSISPAFSSFSSSSVVWPYTIGKKSSESHSGQQGCSSEVSQPQNNIHYVRKNRHRSGKRRELKTRNLRKQKMMKSRMFLPRKQKSLRLSMEIHLKFAEWQDNRYLPRRSG